MEIKSTFVSIIAVCLLHSNVAHSEDGIIHDKTKNTVSITAQRGHAKVIIDYSKGCYIKELLIKGDNKLSASGVYTGITVGSDTYTSQILLKKPTITIHKNKVAITKITYGSKSRPIEESWTFVLQNNSIDWLLSRNYPENMQLEDMSFPKWNFANIKTWKGGIIDNGGMVWCKYLNAVNDTYGVHTGGTTFWDEQSGNALSIQARPAKGSHIATKYSHSPQGEFTSTQLVTNRALKQRYNLSRFVGGKADVFAPASVNKGTAKAQFSISYVDYFKTYSRGDLRNINAPAVRELLNTTARYGVVDNNIVGGNGWTTNWKCLHEPFFAQMALAVADSNYTNNLASTLDQERDLAMLPDGRVLSRWHNARGDEIAGTFNDSTGYYEAMWGYTIDSQTGYVINVSELFNLTGDLKWLKDHQNSCRKALDWLIRRDSNNNGIFEMKNNNISEAKCSDWIDIVWASFENAFVNAQMYDAMMKWANCERILDNTEAAAKYESIAQRLKESFNKSIENGGFWSEEKKQFVYWRDDDGSVHGDNLVTPVQFMAIATGLCDDAGRIKTIIHQIEQRMVAENLFHWPLCFDSYKREEVSGGNWPFPQYENGDIFPTWGYIGVRSYIHYNKELALKYINNLLAQYEKDGLSSQRYSRTTQSGLGNDILSGIATGITALYSDIYGVQPKWNRLVIAPNLTPALYGTRFNYPLRGQEYTIELKEEWYKVSTPSYDVKTRITFGVSGKKGQLTFYPDDQDKTSLSITRPLNKKISLQVYVFTPKEVSFSLPGKGNYEIALKGLVPNAECDIVINGKSKSITSSKQGTVTIKHVQ
ncbi:alpha-L-rhamnosidase-related protein [Niabella aquatica]